jgi:DNA-binding NtrC family response regulator/tetratricopeptide (TPR) repeat protein
MRPDVFADRFVVAPSGKAVDLATGEAVCLRRVSPAGRVQADTWLSRCAALSGFWHPNIVPLVDYGAVGHDGFFEAWACPRASTRWKRRDEATAGAVAAAVEFLASRSLSTGRQARRAVIDLDGRPALFPDEEIGLPIEPEPDGAVRHCATPVERTLARGSLAEVSDDLTVACVSRLMDVLDAGVSGRPRTVRLDIQGREPGRLLPWAFARAARLHGYIPIGSRMLQREGEDPSGVGRWRDAVSGRHVLVLQSEGRSIESTDAALYFLELGLSSDRPHVLLQVNAGSRRPAGHGGTVVREPSAEYVSSTSVVPGGERAWPSGAVIARIGFRDRSAAIVEAAGAGRHAQAERLLRDALGSSARRRDEGAAGESALALGRLLLVRGQPAEAFRVIEQAREHFNRARAADGAVCAAVFAGLAWTDDGRLREAEAALRAARIAAVEMSHPQLDQFAGLALARCLYWQNRPEEARDCLGALHAASSLAHDSPTGDRAPDWTQVERATCARERLQGARVSPSDAATVPAGWGPGAIGLDLARECLASRIALSAGDLAKAGRSAAEARERAAQSGNPTERAAACLVRALVFGAFADVSSVRSAVDEGLDAARSAHAPLRALRLRIALAETLQRAGKCAEAGALVARLARIDRARLPKIVGLQIERAIHGGRSDASLRSRPQSVPLGGLALAPGPRPPAAGDRGVVADAIVEVLDVCQVSPDESSALQRVTAILRERVRAVSITCYGRDQDLTMALASDGSRTKAEEVARRAIDAGIPIAPTSTPSGLEAGVPVRFAGACVGAFGCRWAADVPPDWTVAGAVLAAASAAVAPCVRSEVERRAAPTAPADAGSSELVGVSDAIQGLRHEIGRAARAPFNVVIEGESGSGKELVARAIHRLGPRRHAPLCALNCAALADDLIEAELFGHARGAFTGAVAERKGLFEEADGGILVLDEVGELSARAQAKVLRAIQEGEVRRVGENFTRTVDVRIVAATNRALRAAVEAGAFRRDLLYRLEVIRIVVPPLRSRPDDIPVLAGHFWRQFTARVQSRCTLAPETVAALARYDWPGNVRELQNVMAALSAAVGSRGSVGPGHLPAVIAGQSPVGAAQNLDDARRTFEARFVRAALARAGGRRAQAASDLGLTRQGLTKLMARLGIA